LLSGWEGGFRWPLRWMAEPRPNDSDELRTKRPPLSLTRNFTYRYLEYISFS